MKKNSPLSIYILIDALGWEYIKNKKFLSNILPYRQKLSTLLGFSCACIPSILSGKYPNEHGQWNLFYFSPQTSPFKWAKWIPKFNNALYQRVLRKIIEEISKKISGRDGYFETYIVPLDLLHLFDISERGNIYTPGGLNEAESIFDFMTNNNIKYSAYNYRHGNDVDLINKGVGDIERDNCDVLFLYLPQMDSFLHEYCNDSELIAEKMNLYENKLTYLFNSAISTGRKVNMFIFSDHGMVPTQKTLNLMSLINETKLKQPFDYLVMYDSTMARFWPFSPEAKRILLEKLAHVSQYGKILTEEEKKNEHILFTDNRYGEIIFLLTQGILIEPCHMGTKAPAGMHGCHPENPYCDATIMSNIDFRIKRKDITEIYSLIVNDLETFHVRN